MRLAVRLVPLAALALSPAYAQPAPTLRFFEGETESEGTVDEVFKRPYTVRSRGRGKIEADGTLVMTQLVDQPGKPQHRRSWRMREVSPGRFAGTISDAVGPVTGEAVGGRFHFRFRMKGGLAVEQWLTPMDGNTAVRNAMIIRKFGIKVAKADEVIRKVSR